MNNQLATTTTTHSSFSSPTVLQPSNNPATQRSLTRIVKAQIILLASNLTDSNYSTTKLEIKEVK